MKIQTTRPFDEDYSALPESIKERADKQFIILTENPHHPSLRLKKIEGHHNMNEISFPGSPALWAGSFTYELIHHSKFGTQNFNNRLRIRRKVLRSFR